MNELSANRIKIPDEIARRRTFAIISHPDAGKTTLTEKFLLFGGAIQMAGQVRAKGEARRTRSDYMQMEKDRGISVSASAMSFDFNEFRFNLVDTPGHSDFSEDTYRTLTAVDAAVMVIDGAKGVESQTKKLFEVCRLRDLPTFTFCNKMDRESRDVFEIIDEIQDNLAIDVTPVSWPIGAGQDFIGCYDLINDSLELIDKANRNHAVESIKINGLEDPELQKHVPYKLLTKLVEEVEMVRSLLPKIDKKSILEGHLTPIWFGSAINSFGVKELMKGLGDLAPEPQIQKASPREILPEERNVTGFVFKVQANMDPKHHDRLAFMRIVSGEYQKGMKVLQVSTGKQIKIANAVTFMSRERSSTDLAHAGDVIGIHNHGGIGIGDTFTQGEKINFQGIPNFAPELFRRAQLKDPLKAKALQKGLDQLSEEGATQVFRPTSNSSQILGAVGILQFDVVAHRLKYEYGVDCQFETINVATARWVSGSDKDIEQLKIKAGNNIAIDSAGMLTYLAPSMVNLQLTLERHPDLTFSATREH